MKRDIIRVLGVNIDNLTADEAGERTVELVKESNKSCKLIVAPNTEFIMYAQKDKEFFDILNSASLATPDSIGVELGGKLQKKPFKQRIPGQMYFRKAIEHGTKAGLTFYFLGGGKDIAKKTREHVLKDFPDCKIIGYHEGYFVEDSEEDVIKEINRLQPNVLFVAMGAPKQEKWIAKHQKELKVDVATGQGGTFDFEAGKILRAPKWIQKIGMEWLWRLCRQPKRIFRMRVLPIYFFKILFRKDKTKSDWDIKKSKKVKK